ncbi:hypothetical protein ACA910_008920 [Epithemia clementina (nom. ined.)]
MGGRLILLRHGQSEWNAGSHKSEARFTGWANVALTELGRAQAVAAAQTLQNFLQREQLVLDGAYVSLLDRAKDTLFLILQELGHLQQQQQPPQQRPITTGSEVRQPYENHRGKNSINAPTMLTTDSQTSSSDSNRRIDDCTSVSTNTAPPTTSSCIDKSPQVQTTGATTTAPAATAVPNIPITFTWRLNERHYGGLVGQSKAWAEQNYDQDLLDQWRHSWHEPPPPMDRETLEEWSATLPHCQRITVRQENVVVMPQESLDSDSKRNKKISGQLNSQWTWIESSSNLRASPCHYKNGAGNEKGNNNHMDKISDHTEQEHQDAVPFPMPSSEAFGHVLERLWPIWQNQMEPQLAQGQTLLLVGHANSVKALLHILDPHVVNPQTIRHVKIPNTTPLVYAFRFAGTTTTKAATNTATTTPTTATGDEEGSNAAETRPVRENCYPRYPYSLTETASPLLTKPKHPTTSILPQHNQRNQTPSSSKVDATETSSRSLQLLEVVPPHFLDAPLNMEPRHALRATWLERAWIPATPQGIVLDESQRYPAPPPFTRFLPVVVEAAATAPSLRPP